MIAYEEGGGCVNLVNRSLVLWRGSFGSYADGCSAVFLWGEVEKLYYDDDESYLLVMMYPTLKRTPRQLFYTFLHNTSHLFWPQIVVLILCFNF